MLLSGFRLEDGQIKLDGYPEGASVRGIGGPKAQELCRVALFRSDLVKTGEWLGLADVEGQESPFQEALYVAALIKFCSCFEGTSGLRAKPLKQKKVFSSDDRKVLERLRQIRNKLVAHDEHLYPGEFPFIILDCEAAAIEAVTLTLSAPFSAMSDVHELRRLAKIAIDWVSTEYESTAAEIVAEINALPASERRRLRDTTPEFRIEIGSAEDRF
jgi:hypothetical protein